MQPHRRQPTRLPRLWDSPGKYTGVGCHFFLQCMKVKSESQVSQSCPSLSDAWSAAFQAPPSMGFSRQEYWSGVPLPSPSGILAAVISRQERGRQGKMKGRWLFSSPETCIGKPVEYSFNCEIQGAKRQEAPGRTLLERFPGGVGALSAGT